MGERSKAASLQFAKHMEQQRAQLFQKERTGEAKRRTALSQAQRDAEKARLDAEAEAAKLKEESAALKAQAEAEASALKKTADAVKAQAEAEVAALKRKAEHDAEELVAAGAREVEEMKRRYDEEQFHAELVVLDCCEVDVEDWQVL